MISNVNPEPLRLGKTSLWSRQKKKKKKKKKKKRKVTVVVDGRRCAKGVGNTHPATPTPTPTPTRTTTRTRGLVVGAMVVDLALVKDDLRERPGVLHRHPQRRQHLHHAVKDLGGGVELAADHQRVGQLPLNQGKVPPLLIQLLGLQGGKRGGGARG